MALVELLTALEAEAAVEAARRDAEARAPARVLVEEARTEARAIEERTIRADEDELGRETAQRVAAARLAAAATLREAREECFRTLLADVRARLADLRESDGYRAVLRATIRESMAAVPAATALRVDPRDESLASKLVGELDLRLTVAPTLETAGGVELLADDGRSVRNTLEERLANAEPVLRLLFGELLADRARPLERTAVNA
jgi:V/A-type H+-transporting ATPase subunit E